MCLQSPSLRFRSLRFKVRAWAMAPSSVRSCPPRSAATLSRTMTFVDAMVRRGLVDFCVAPESWPDGEP